MGYLFVSRIPLWQQIGWMFFADMKRQQVQLGSTLGAIRSEVAEAKRCGREN